MTHALAVGLLLLAMVGPAVGSQTRAIRPRRTAPRCARGRPRARRRAVLIAAVAGSTEKNRATAYRTHATLQILHGARWRPPRTGRGNAGRVIHGIGSDELDVVPRGVERQTPRRTLLGGRSTRLRSRPGRGQQTDRPLPRHPASDAIANPRFATMASIIGSEDRNVCCLGIC